MVAADMCASNAANVRSNEANAPLPPSHHEPVAMVDAAGLYEPPVLVDEVHPVVHGGHPRMVREPGADVVDDEDEVDIGVRPGRLARP